MNPTAEYSYDLFVSYSQADRGWVEGYLLDALAAANVRVISELNFTLGAPRLAEFERALKQSKRTLLVLSPAYLAESALQFVDLMMQSYGMESGAWPVIPLIFEEVELPPRLAFLGTLDATEVESWPQEVARLCQTVQAGPPAPAARPPCPYPGMRAFRLDEAAHFYGREAEVDELVQRLRLHPFVAVIGPSGSGKSSLVLAGLLPALQRSALFGAGPWLTRVVRPGDHPLAALSAGLGVAEMSQFTPGPLLTAENAARLLVVIDQFEEIFTLGHGRNEFFGAIQRLISLRDCYVVVTVRSDFFTDLLNSSLWPTIDAHRLEIAPLGVNGMRAAIVKPAEDMGVFIESALVERLTLGSAGQPGLLPFLQEVMARLWEKLERRYLPLRAYEALILPLAGYSGSERESIIAALALLADEVLHRLTPVEQAMARRIFLRLVQFGEGRLDTRRQQPVSALAAVGDAPGQLDRVLNYLADNRLVVLSGDEAGGRRVDLAHEAMLTGWPKLANWVKEGAEAEKTRRRYEQQAQEWVVLGKNKRGLLSDADLVALQAWLISPVAQDAGLTAILLAWRDACQKYVRAQRNRMWVMRSLSVGLALFIVSAGLWIWATLNPVVTGWNVASALPVSGNEPGANRSDLRIRLTPGEPDRVYLLDTRESRLFESSDGGRTWRKIALEQPNAVDMTVSREAVCLLYVRSLLCRRLDKNRWLSLPFPETRMDNDATALAADPQNGELLAVAFSNGQVELSENFGNKWRTIATVANASPIGRLGFSGKRLVALSSMESQGSALIIELGSGKLTLITPEPEWPTPVRDLSIPSSLGRFLVAAADGIVDADAESVEWSPYFDPPPTPPGSFAAWEDDVYVVDDERVYCRRVWTVHQLNWWRDLLGVQRPCMNSS